MSNSFHSLKLAIERFMAVFLVVINVLTAIAQQDDSGEAEDLSTRKKEQLEERNRLSRESTRLASAGKLDEALAVAQRALTLERKMFGDIHEAVVGSLERIESLHLARDDIAAAQRVLVERISVKQKLLDADPLSLIHI